MIFLLFSCWKDTESIPWETLSLWAIQTVWTQQSDIQDTVKKSSSLTQTQEDIFTISQVLQVEWENFTSSIIEILGKYKTNLSQSDIEAVTNLLSQNLSQQQLRKSISDILSVNFLESDTTLKLVDEKNVQIQRLKTSQDRQTMMLVKQRDTTIEKLIEEIISSKQDWSEYL